MSEPAGGREPHGAVAPTTIGEAHFEGLLDGIPERVAYLDLDLNYLYVNEAYAHFMKRPKSEIIGRNLAEIRGAEATAMVRDHVTRTLAGEQVRWEGWHSYTTGTQRFIERYYSVHRNASGTPEGFRIFVRDLTELKQAEQSLRESEQRFRAIAAAHPVPLIITRISDGRVLFANSPFLKLIGAKPDTLTGRPSATLFADSERGNLFASGFQEGSFPDGLEVQMTKTDGTIFWASLTARRIAFDSEQAVVTSVVDLTERRNAEQEIARQREALHQSEKLSALGSLLSNVAHELNNPLSVVLGHSQILAESDHGAPVTERAAKIQSAAKRCAGIVRTFLSLARNEESLQRPVSLNEIVGNALTLMDYGLRTAGIEVVTDLADDLPETSADADQIPLVATNLLLNAQQALQDFPEPRKLWIKTDVDESRTNVRLTVADNGPGVPADMRERIFEQFVTSKPHGRGTGVGLAVSQSILSAHEGKITVTDTPGGGATFVVSLPIVAATGVALPRRAEPDEIMPPSVGHGQALLIVEDEPDVSDMLAEMLTPDGFDVYVAESGRAAVRLLGDRDFGIIISDLRMPDMDGPALFRWIQKERPHLVDGVIFVTGDMLSAASRQFLDTASRPHLEKPLNPADVRRAVGRIVQSDAEL